MMQIRYRRALLALRYAKGFRGHPPNVVPRVLAYCWAGSLLLASDLRWVLGSLPVPVAVDYASRLTAEGIDGLKNEVEVACDAALKSEIDALVKTQFLKNRVEPDDNVKLVAVTRRFRHYPPTCECATSNRVHAKGLAICGFGCVEDECHALLVCSGHSSLWTMGTLSARCLRPATWISRDYSNSTLNAIVFHMVIVHCREVTKRLANFVYNIFTVFEQTEMLIPASHYVHEGVQ
ncbi:hypothetical protein C8R43DRAFT_966165 [Mycena crocata]|nr:hypothetical protein C8R43DRAFT_966165 [Mycena crocata]